MLRSWRVIRERRHTFNSHLLQAMTADNSLSVCPPACLPLPAPCPLPQCPLDSRSMSYFQTCLASLPSFHSFHSSPKPVGLLGKSVSGSGMCREWSPSPDSGRTSQPPSIFCPHPSEHLFQMWLFSHPLCHFSAWLLPHLCISMAG